MDQKNLTLVVGGFIALIIGVSLITIVASEGLKKTTLTGVLDEAIDISGARDYPGTYDINITDTYDLSNKYTGAWQDAAAGCDFASVTYSNASTDFTVTTDYTISTSGVLTLVNSTEMIASETNSTLIDYQYCGDDYLVVDWNRSVLNLVPGFFGIALLLVAVGMFYAVMKNEGLINI